MRTFCNWSLVVGIFLMGCHSESLAVAPAGSKAIRELVEYLMKSKKVPQSAARTVSQRITQLSAKHGPDVISAVRKVGPRAISLIEDAGPHAGAATKLLAKYGDDSVWIVSRQQAMALYLRYGDATIPALMKHKGIATPIVQEHGASAARALGKINRRSGRRLAMMVDEGDLDRIGRIPALLETIEKHGDKAMEFIWRHKKALMVATALAAFLSNPEPFIDGTVDIVSVGVAEVAGPIAEIPKQIAAEAARNINWNLMLIMVCATALIALILRSWRQSITRKQNPKLNGFTRGQA